MPFKSESQRRLFYAKMKRGEISRATVDEWEKETGSKKLPKYVKGGKRGKRGHSGDVSGRIVTR